MTTAGVLKVHDLKVSVKEVTITKVKIYLESVQIV